MGYVRNLVSCEVQHREVLELGEVFHLANVVEGEVQQRQVCKAIETLDLLDTVVRKEPLGKQQQRRTGECRKDSHGDACENKCSRWEEQGN